ncbi:hypothetical protein Glove_213g87 [Diversispora epigaea]|uniref:BTB domain-containing protein n=1 Tax=Diversispora epigaea TaxID=1348612 RepID=A0A397INZ9_9GLOM|nr:hypothetical protein Glove_213g87 [Diversispora epigaea]
MSLNFFDKLSQNLIELLNDGDDYNVIIEVENKEKSFTAHSNVLKFRSSYFRRDLENIRPNENNIKIIIKSSISAQIFNVILQYIYGGTVCLENCETRFIYDLMLVADEFELEELTNKLETLLIETKGSWLRTHFSFIYHSIFSRNNFEKLKNFCNDIIVKYPDLIFVADDFTSLKESALISLIKRNDLQIEEVKIWDYVIKWGIAQTSTLPTNLDDWTKENFLTLKTTLQQCLPHIRYFHLSVADEFELEELTNKLETLLIETKGSWLRTHFSFIYHSIFSRNNFEKLKNFCNDIIVKYPDLIFVADDFTSLKESALISLIKRNDLQIEEVKIWDYVIKWGIAQTSTLPTNLDDWTKENFLTLKTTLQQCLPHIRYFHLLGIEVLDKIQPYKKILDKQLWKDINQRLIAPERPVKSTILPPRSVLITELPPRSKESFSTIISEEHAAEISTWIDRKTTVYTLTNIPYKFELILRGTQDGFAPQTFWNICHGHICTVVLVKVKGTDEIVGGYNPLAWDKNTDGQWMETKDSFIFSLKNGDIPNSILSRVKNTKCAVLNISKNDQIRYGPHFSDFRMCSHKSDFTLDNYCFCRNYGFHYEKPIRSSSEYFSIINYEVFKIVRKTI